MGNLPSNIESNKDELISLRNSLGQVEEDFYLGQDGYKIHFAIDFAELFLFIYPVSRVASEFRYGLGKRPSDEKLYKSLSCQRVALSFIFYNLSDSLILLPPYANELNNHLKSIQRSAANYVGAKHLVGVGEKQIKKIKDNADVKKILDSVKQGNDLTTSQKRTLTKIFETNYRTICTLLTVNSKYLNTAHEFFKTGRILNLGGFFKDFKISHESILEHSKEWLEKISEQPGRKDRYYQNETDAHACEYLKLLNKHLNQKKEAIVLITQSHSLQQTLKDKDFIKLPGKDKPVSPVRSLTYILNRLICSDSEHKIDFNRINSKVETIDRMIFQIESVENNPPEKEEKKELLNKIKDIDNKISTFRNLYEFLETSQNYSERYATNYNEIEKFYKTYGIDSKIILNLVSNEEFKAELEARAINLWAEVNQQSWNISGYLNTNWSSLEYLTKYLIPERQLVTFKASSEQHLYIPYLLKILGKASYKIIAPLFNEMAKETRNYINTIVNNVYHNASSLKNPDCNIILSILCAHIGEKNISLDLVRHSIKAVDQYSTSWTELTLFGSLLQRNLITEPKKIDSWIVNNLKRISKSGEPRAFLELATWSWIKTIDLKGSKKENYEESISKAIELTAEGLEHPNLESSIRFHLLNKQAYFLAERNIGRDIDRAVEVINILEKEFPNICQIKNGGERKPHSDSFLEKLIFDKAFLPYCDTAGFVYGRKASQFGLGWESLKGKACSLISKVLLDGKNLLPWQRILVSKHLDECRAIEK
jgi:hypothetical protein